MRFRVSLVFAASLAALGGGVVAHQVGSPGPAPGSQATAAAPVSEASGAISGVVLDAVTGRPLAGAVVLLQAPARGRGPGATMQTTDEKGRFIFTKLPAAATYGFQTSTFGYADSRTEQRLSLADGQWLQDVKISLSRLGSISGTVVDEAGDRAVGVYVRVLVQVMVAGRPQLAAGPVGRTDDRGLYRIAGLGPGKYFVHVPSVQVSVPAGTPDAVLSGTTPQAAAQAEAAGRTSTPRRDQTISPDGKNLLMLGSFATPPVPEGGRAMAYPMIFYPGARVVAEASAIDLGRGEQRPNIDIQLRPVPAVRVSGVLDAPPGAEPAGMTARLMPVGLEGMGNGSETATALVRTDGAFTFLNVPAGDYTILANRSVMEYASEGGGRIGAAPSVPPGWGNAGGGSGGITSATEGTEYRFQTSRGSQAFSGRAHVTVGARDVTDVVVPLKHTVTISGRIVYDEGVKSADNPSPFGTIVLAEPAFGDAALGMHTGRGAAGGDMAFSVDGLSPGVYALRFGTIGAVGVAIKSVMWDGKDYATKPFDVSEGRDVSGVLVTVTDKVAKLSGFVRDEHGQIASHGNVIVFPQERDEWSGYGFSPPRIASVAVSTNGAYSLPRIRPGEYYVIAVDESLATAWQDPGFLEAAATLASRLTINWADAKTIDVVRQLVPFKAGGRP